VHVNAYPSRNQEVQDFTPPSTALHSVVKKLLYVGMGTCTYIPLALAFLCGQVSKPTVQDQKLKQLLEYFNGTTTMHMKLGADILSSVLTWVDASFGVHPNIGQPKGMKEEEMAEAIPVAM
jgi:hypothetical protein